MNTLLWALIWALDGASVAACFVDVYWAYRLSTIARRLRKEER